MDQNTVVYNDLNPPISARYIRFRPTAWNKHISMRTEVYGCQVEGTIKRFTFEDVRATLGFSLYQHLEKLLTLGL